MLVQSYTAVHYCIPFPRITTPSATTKPTNMSFLLSKKAFATFSLNVVRLPAHTRHPSYPRASRCCIALGYVFHATQSYAKQPLSCTTQLSVSLDMSSFIATGVTPTQRTATPPAISKRTFEITLRYYTALRHHIVYILSHKRIDVTTGCVTLGDVQYIKTSV